MAALPPSASARARRSPERALDEIWPRASAPASKIRLILIDDHALVREGVRALLELEPDIEVVADVGSREEALRALACLAVDLIITDISLPGEPGIEGIADLRRHCPDTPLLVLTVHDTDLHVRGAIAAGANGYIVKDATRAALLRAIRATVHGQQYWDPRLAEKILAACLRQWNAQDHAPPLEITDEERRMLTLIAMGVSNRDIASHLGRGVKALEKHRAKLLRRLGLTNAATVARFAVKYGFLADRGFFLHAVGTTPGSGAANTGTSC